MSAVGVVSWLDEGGCLVFFLSLIMATKKEIKYLKENFDYEGLKIIGFYDKKVKALDYDEQIKRVCKYFGFANIFQYDTVMLSEATLFKPDLKTFSDN